MTFANIYLNSDIVGKAGYSFQVSGQFDETRPDTSAYLTMSCTIRGKARNEQFIRFVNAGGYEIMGRAVPPIVLDRMDRNQPYGYGRDVDYNDPAMWEPGFAVNQMSGYTRRYTLRYFLSVHPQAERRYGSWNVIVLDDLLDTQRFYQWYDALKIISETFRAGIDGGRR